MLYGSETWPVKVEDTQRLHRNEMSMIRWMCGAKLRDRKSCDELRSLLGIKSYHNGTADKTTSLVVMLKGRTITIG